MSVGLLSVVQLSEMRQGESSDGDHEDGVDEDDHGVDAPRLEPLQLQEDLEQRVDQKPFFAGMKNISQYQVFLTTVQSVCYHIRYFWGASGFEPKTSG